MLYGTTHGGVVRLEYYDNPESMMTGSSKRTIPLRECTEVSSTIGSKVHPYAFQFTSQLGQSTYPLASSVKSNIQWSTYIYIYIYIYIIMEGVFVSFLSWLFLLFFSLFIIFYFLMHNLVNDYFYILYLLIV